MATQSSLVQTLLAAINADVHEPYGRGDSVRAALSEVASQYARAYVGGVTGTGVALPVVTATPPDFVAVFNQTTGALCLHFDGMADASMLEMITGGITYVAANGITLSATGFTLGTDAQLNANGNIIWYFAIDV